MRIPTARFLDWTFGDPADDVALDEALLIEAEDFARGPTVRTWELDRLAVVLGASGRLVDDVDVDACRRDGVEIVRRSSGGGTVLIGPGALNVSVVLPIADRPEYRSVDVAQKAILESLASAIRDRGVPATVQGSGDLTLGDRKFSGSAQRRLRHHLMVHASILYDFPLDMVSRYLRPPTRQPAYRSGRPHDDFLVNVPLDRRGLLRAIGQAWAVDPGGSSIADIPKELVRELSATKFRDRTWIERL